jgi:hypothetical protein
MPDVVRALRAWWELRGRPGPDDPVFVNPQGERITEQHLADLFREHLRLAGVERPQLFERTAKRRPVRAHDLRATFVTLALATGRTETWVADRTGHRSSQMIARYRRSARLVSELGLGWLGPLDELIPELANMQSGRPIDSAIGSARDSDKPPRSGKFNHFNRVHEEGLEPSSLAAPEPKAHARAGKGGRSGGFSGKSGPGEPGSGRVGSGAANSPPIEPGELLVHLAAELRVRIEAGDLAGAREIHARLGQVLQRIA